jgi:hypothetical protein
MDDSETRKREFVRLFRQFTPWATAEILGEVIEDVDFRKRSKHQMAEDYAHGRYGLDKKSLQDLGTATVAAVTAHTRMRAGDNPPKRKPRPRRCAIHNVEMVKYARGASGSSTRYMHQTAEGKWCRGR